MKIQMQLTVLSATDTLYHGTKLEKAVSIMTDTHFVLRPSAVATDEQRIAPNTYFLSTARSLYSSYFRNVSLVFFELDGKKVNTRYKIKPVNFFPEKFGKKLPEYEDRIISKYPTLSIAYVKAIHCPLLFNDASEFIDVMQTPQHLYAKYVNELHRAAIKNKIPIYFYNTAEIRSTSPTNRVTHSIKKLNIKPLPLPETPYFDPDLAVSPPSQREQLNTKIVKALLRVVKDPPSKQVLQSIEPVSSYLLNDSRVSSVLLKFGTALTPIVTKMRKKRWEISHLMDYIAAKIHYMETGYLKLQAALSNPSPALARAVVKDTTYDYFQVELELAKEYNIDNTLESQVRYFGGIPALYDYLDSRAMEAI